MRILMVGAGATGGYYGGRLAQAGRDVTFLVRGERLRQLQTHGLQIVSPLGDATVAPKLITAADLPQAGTFDVVIISVKAYSLAAAIADFAPAVGPGTVVVPLLNGMAHLDVLAERFGREKIVPGSVRIVADVDTEGRVLHLTELDAFTFGSLDGGHSRRTEQLLEQFSVFGFSAILSENIQAVLWHKWWLLATMNGVCVVGGGTAGDMTAAPYGKETARAILQEAVDIAAANGYPSPAEQVEEHARRMTAPGSTLTSSMFRDYQRGAAVEADHIFGDLLARAKGVAAPLLKGAYIRLKIYEAKRETR